MSNIGTLPSERLAGLSADLFHKVQSGSISLNELALFLQRKNPFSFERNEYGHIVLTIKGLDLTGEQEIQRLEVSGFDVVEQAKFCLRTKGEDCYDESHRLQNGQLYRIALMPTREIEDETGRMAHSLFEYGATCYGYERPLAGVVPRIRELLSDKQMEEMGFQYIRTLHDNIRSYLGDQLYRFDVGRFSTGKLLTVSEVDDSGQYCPPDGAVAFLLP